MAKETPDITNPNPLVDTSKTTSDAYLALKNKGMLTNNNERTLGVSDTKWYTSPTFKSEVYVYTPLDNQQHRYWTSMNIDVQVQDFMGTCELHAPYDSDLMAYWQPIAQFCIVYGSNNGPAKVLFVGRVREVKQDGYECVVTLQNYGWKFQQDAPAKFVQDNVTNKDGLTIIKNIFEVLKITGYTISENAAQRLKEVGINEDGNLTLNGKEVTEMPDLLKRLQALDKADMTKIMGKQVITEKEKEENLNWRDIYRLNYTLRYSEPTATMTKLNDSSNYSAGKNVYQNVYGSAGNAASTVAGALAGTDSKGTFKSDKTKTGSEIWTAISIIVNKFVKVSSGTINGEKIINQYIRRLYKADAKWENIAKVIQGHPIKQAGISRNFVIRTIYYIKKDGLDAKTAAEKAATDEKAVNGNAIDKLNKALADLTSFLNSRSI